MRLLSIAIVASLMLTACDRPVTDPVAESDGFRPAASVERTTFPSADDPGPPFYARIESAPPHFLIAGDWAVVIFYRDPDCIPAGFNLLEFFAIPAAFGCAPLVQGSNLWRNGVLGGPPLQALTTEAGPVDTWILPAGTALAAAADGVLTIGELAGLPGLVTGFAYRLRETLHPHDGHPQPMLTIQAAGELEDGSSFSLHYVRTQNVVRTARLTLR